MPDIKRSLRKFVPVLSQACEDKLSHGDTIGLACTLLHEVMGYDPLHDILREPHLDGGYADICVTVDGSVRLLVTVKAVGHKLSDTDVAPLEPIARCNRVHWLVLTDGVDWNLYRCQPDEHWITCRVHPFKRTNNWKVTDVDELAPLLGLLHKSAMISGDLDRLWCKHYALSDDSILRALMSAPMLQHLRSQIQDDAGVVLEEEEVGAALRGVLTRSHYQSTLLETPKTSGKRKARQ